MPNVTITGISQANIPVVTENEYQGNLQFSTGSSLDAINIAAASTTYYSQIFATPANGNNCTLGVQIAEGFTGSPNVTINLYGAFEKGTAYSSSSANWSAALSTLTVSNGNLTYTQSTNSLLFPYWQIQAIAASGSGTGFLNFFLYFITS